LHSSETARCISGAWRDRCGGSRRTNVAVSRATFMMASGKALARCDNEHEPDDTDHGPDPAASKDEIDAAISICDAALEEVRRLARALRPQILDDLGLAAALRWLARSQSPATSVEVDVERLDATLPLELATVAFRVAQEGLANAVRHGQARNVVLRAFMRADCLNIWVVDDGNGFDATDQQVASRRGEGSGLSGMRERVELMGGTFRLQTQPGEGVQIRVLLPIAEDTPR